MVVFSLTSSKFWDIGENHRNSTHLRPNSTLSQKQNEFIDAFTMVHQISDRRMQAIMNNLQLIIFDYLAAKKSGILDWRRGFCHWSTSSLSIGKVMSSIPVHESTIHSKIMLHTRTLNTELKLWCGGVPWALCSTWYAIYACVWRNNHLLE